MFDIGWQELFLIAVVALVVVGPKDLPKVLRTAARVMQKARAMSREFQSGLAEMAREAELDDIKRKMEGAARFDLGDELRKSVDPTGKLSSDFDPAEFNRQLKESVEGGPPAATSLPPSAEHGPLPVEANVTAPTVATSRVPSTTESDASSEASPCSPDETPSGSSSGRRMG